VPGHHSGWLPQRIAEALDQSERLCERAQAVKELALPFGGGAPDDVLPTLSRPVSPAARQAGDTFLLPAETIRLATPAAGHRAEMASQVAG